MHPQPKYKNSAAFYDVDGTLIKINIVHTFAYYASRHASLTESVTSTIKTALSIPLFWAADKLSRKYFNEIFYRSYEGASEDRLVTLAEEMFEDIRPVDPLGFVDRKTYTDRLVSCLLYTSPSPRD